jgi:hypothetical protein
MTQSLEDLTKEINVRLVKSDNYDGKADDLVRDLRQKAEDHRIAAGKLMIEARKLVEAGEAGDVTWTKWCSQNINRCRQDIHKIMKIAGHVEPEKALKDERAAAREGMAKHRDKLENVANGEDVSDIPQDENVELTSDDESADDSAPAAQRPADPPTQPVAPTASTQPTPDTPPTIAEPDTDVPPEFPDPPEFAQDAEAIRKKGASSYLVHAVRSGFVTYSRAEKLISKPPESQERAIRDAENKWRKPRLEQKQIHQRACIEAAVRLLGDQDFRRFVELLRRADFFVWPYNNTAELLRNSIQTEAQKRGIVDEDEDEESAEQAAPELVEPEQREPELVGQTLH